MSKRGMRAAGVCLVTVVVMSGSVTADGAVTPSDSTQKLAAKDFTITYTASRRFSDNVKEAVLRPNGFQPLTRYEIVVTHPESIDQIDGVTLHFQRGDGSGWKHFRMRGVVESQPSTTSTILLGSTDFQSRSQGDRARARPGAYAVERATLRVTDGGESINVNLAPPAGRIHLLYRTKIVLAEPTIRNGRIRLEGRVRAYNGEVGSKSDQWSPLTDREAVVNCIHFKGKWGIPTVVKTKTPRTDETGRFSVRPRVCEYRGRWGSAWVAAYRGDGRLHGSGSSF